MILDEGNKIEVTEDEEGNQTVVVKDKDGKEVSKVTVNESKPENVSVPQGSTGKETSTGNSGSNNGGSSDNGGNSGNGGSSGGSGSGNNSSRRRRIKMVVLLTMAGTLENWRPSGGSGSGNNGSSNGEDQTMVVLLTMELCKRRPSSRSCSGDNGSTEDKPDNSSHWWDGLSVSQIRAKVTGAMVWKNEITGQTYKGVDNLTFAWNQENIVFGGLKLVSNPYNVDLPYSFPGGRGGMISTDTFEMFWNLPEGTYNGMKGIN